LYERGEYGRLGKCSEDSKLSTFIFLEIAAVHAVIVSETPRACAVTLLNPFGKKPRSALPAKDSILSVPPGRDSDLLREVAAET
jgi:hypothetical protein